MKTQRMFLFFLILSLAITQGCSSLIKIERDFTYDHEKKGLVFGSVTQTGGHTAWVYIRKAGSEDEIQLSCSGSNAIYEIQDDPKYGSLFVLDLEPGKYEIVRWMLYEFIGGINVYSYYAPVAVKPIEFEVRLHEAVYLANFHVVATKGKALFFIPVVLTAEGQIHDEYERDVKLFHQKYPQLEHLNIRKSVPNADLWKGLRVKRI
jgi:hypothetical protein